jgi:peptidoglycan-N-acetylglucosamine deacetylase
MVARILLMTFRGACSLARSAVRVCCSYSNVSEFPESWMKPLERGQETDLIEIPASWHLDDLPPMMFIERSPNSHGFVSPDVIEKMSCTLAI